MLLARLVKGNSLHYLTIVLCAVVGHGLLLLNDGIYWDDWVWFDLRNNAYHSDRVFAASEEMGSLPYEKYFGRLFSIFPSKVIASKFFVFLAIVAVGLALFRICRASGYFDRRESLLIAVIAIVYPANKTQVVMSTAFYQIYLAVFLAACQIALENVIIPRSRARFVVLRVSSIVLFFVSFSMTSLIVFFFCFMLFLLYRSYTQLPAGDSFIKKVRRSLSGNIDYLLAPIAFWLVKSTLFHPYGYYEGYRQLQASPQTILQAMKELIAVGTYGQFEFVIDLVKSRVFPWMTIPSYVYLLFAIVTIFGYGLVIRKAAITRQNVFHLLGPLAFALMLVAAAILPYAVIGHSSSYFGMDTRNLILLGIPMAMVLVASLRVSNRASDGHLSTAGASLLVLPIVGFILVLTQSYLHWELRWMKDLSVMRQLGQSDSARGVSVFRIDDRFYTRIGDESYQFYEWSGMFYHINGTEATVGLDLEVFPDPDRFLTQSGGKWFVERYNLRDFDPYGCQALLTISRGLHAPSVGLVYRYYYLKFFGSQEELNDYLSQVADVEVTPVRSPVARHCPAD